MISNAMSLAMVLLAAAPPSEPACQLLTSAEVQRVAGAVTVDPSQSGPGEGGGEFCAWKTGDGHFVILGVYGKASVAAARAEYAAELVGAFGGGPAAIAIDGVGDEAQYRDYTGGLRGGVVVIRSRRFVLTVEGPMSRQKVLALSRIVLARLPAQ